MSSNDIGLLAVAAALTVLAAILASADAALSTFSKSRSAELVNDGRPGAVRVRTLAEDPPRYLNTVLLVRMTAEIVAVVLVTLVVISLVEPLWLRVLIAAGSMVLVSYVLIGVGSRTLGKQHAEAIALRTAGPVVLLTRVLGPLPRVLILLGNALTPGKGFREGPFNSEAELRELVDLAEANRLIESDERAMIHSVFELGDTIVREVMVPRTEMVYIERHKTLRQTMSLALRSGYSRIPVVGDSLDDVVGMAYLKDVTRRTFDNRDAGTTERAESIMRPCLYVPDSKPVDAVSARCRAPASTWLSSSTSTGARPAWSPSRTCSRRSSVRSTTSTTSRRKRSRGSQRHVPRSQPVPDRRPGRGDGCLRRGRGRRLGRRPDGQAPRPGAHRRQRGHPRGPALPGGVTDRAAQPHRHRARASPRAGRQRRRGRPGQHRLGLTSRLR
jgi:hypothetical protein